MTLFHGLGPIASSLAAAGNFDFITSASGTTAASISVDNCFSASYSTYLVMRDFLGSGVGQVDLRLRVGGADASGANYRREYLYATSTTVGGARYTGATLWEYALGYKETTTFGFSRLWISNPFEAVRTTGWVDHSVAATGNIEIGTHVMAHDLETSYTGFTAIPNSGTITGTIWVYGVKS